MRLSGRRSSPVSSYAAAEQRDRWKAMLAALVATGAIGAAIVAGLNVETVRTAIDRLKTFNLAQPPPPPPVPPPPRPRPSAAKKPEGSPAKRAEPAPVVAAQPRIPLPSPIPAAKVAGAGNASTSGAAGAGNGTGAGGTGNGAGGGGTDYSRFTPAQLIRNLTRGDYRSIAQGRLSSGRAMVSLRVEPTGAPSNCRVIRSSGDAVVDDGLCPLIEARLRFRPALDDQGRPIAYQLQYVATWNL
jgi:protein TonB